MLLPEIVVNMVTSLGQDCLENKVAPGLHQTENMEASVLYRQPMENKVELVHYHLLMVINVLVTSLTRPLMGKHVMVKDHLGMVQNNLVMVLHSLVMALDGLEKVLDGWVTALSG